MDSTVKKDENYYPQVFLKMCKYIEKMVIRHFIVDLESSSDDSDEELIKAAIYFERGILQMCFLKMSPSRVIFWKCIF